VAILLALCSAGVYGIADYCGGHASRRWPSAAVTCLGQAVGLAALLVLLPILGDPAPPARDWAWGAAAGVAGVVGLVSFYRALAEGAMTVVAPTTAAVTATVPVIAGLALGERPGAIALAGIGLAVVAIILVSGAAGGHPQARPTPPAILALAVLAGAGFGALFVCLDRTSAGSGLWPFVPLRLVSIPIAFAIALRSRAQWRGRPDPALLRLILLSGLLDMAATVLFLLANRRGLLAVVGVIAALYPVSTVVLAMARDGERVTRWQVVGLVVAATAIACVATS